MTDPTVRRTDPLAHDDYLKQREALRVSYTESIREYDRLVTWASAGALGLSVTFLEKFGQDADVRTAWWLGVGWASLLAAFATSLWSQYASSRIHSWRRNELDHLQLEPAKRLTTWQTEAVRLHRVASRYGFATKWLTFISGVLLVGGIMFVATFAFLNAPFKPAENTTSDAPRTVAVPVTEKKGLEYIPEPVPRPQSTPPTGPPPQEKR
jgi:hypothetical protein